MFCSFCGTKIPEQANFCGACGKRNARAAVKTQKNKRVSWILVLLVSVGGFAILACAGAFALYVLHYGEHTTTLSRSDGSPKPQFAQPAGCLELPAPSADCLAILQRIGFSTKFVRSGWTAFHYADAWWPAAHGRGGEKFDRSVYEGRVVASLDEARKLAGNSKDRVLLRHESGALELLRLYDGYSQLRDSEIASKQLEAFRVLTGTTPERFAQAVLQGADQCMLAAVNDLRGKGLSEDWKTADSDCTQNYRLLHRSP